MGVGVKDESHGLQIRRLRRRDSRVARKKIFKETVTQFLLIKEKIIQIERLPKLSYKNRFLNS